MVSTNIRDFGEELLAQHAIRCRGSTTRCGGSSGSSSAPGSSTTRTSTRRRPSIRASFVTANDRAAARTAAGKSMVLLKNDGGTLPLDPNKSVAVIGPLGNDQHDMLGPWWGQGRDTDAVSSSRDQGAGSEHDVQPGLHDPGQGPAEQHARRTSAARRRVPGRRRRGERRRPGRARPRREPRDERRGDARSEIDLPGNQQELINAIKARASRSTSCCSTAVR